MNRGATAGGISNCGDTAHNGVRDVELHTPEIHIPYGKLLQGEKSGRNVSAEQLPSFWHDPAIWQSLLARGQVTIAQVSQF
jgi:hypothetical protein